MDWCVWPPGSYHCRSQFRFPAASQVPLPFELRAVVCSQRRAVSIKLTTRTYVHEAQQRQYGGVATPPSWPSPLAYKRKRSFPCNARGLLFMRPHTHGRQAATETPSHLHASPLSTIRTHAMHTRRKNYAVVSHATLLCDTPDCFYTKVLLIVLSIYKPGPQYSCDPA